MSQTKSLKKITSGEIASMGVQSLADRPNAASNAIFQYGTNGLSSTQLKLAFDRLATFLAEKINELQDTLNSDDSAQYIRISLDDYGIYNLSDLVSCFSDGTFASGIIKLLPNETSQELGTLQTVINGISDDIFSVKDEMLSMHLSVSDVSTLATKNENDIASINESIDLLGASMELSFDHSSGILTAVLKNSEGGTIGTYTVNISAISPTVSVTSTENGSNGSKLKITVTDKNGTKTSEFNIQNGTNGITPSIGANGNWYIGDTDTGVCADTGPLVETNTENPKTYKLYVSDDDYIYAAQTVEDVSLLDESANLVGEYTADARINSSGAVAALTSGTDKAWVTDYISCAPGDVIRIRNAIIDANGSAAVYGQTPGGLNIRCYDADKAAISGAGLSWLSMTGTGDGDIFSDRYYDDNGYCIQFTIRADSTTVENTAYIRITLGGDPTQAVVTVNTEIPTVTQLSKLGVRSTAYDKAVERIAALETQGDLGTSWDAEIATTIDTVREKQLSAGIDCINFAWTSDMHIDPTSYANGTEDCIRIGSVMATVMERCDTPYAVISGDSTTQSNGYNVSDLVGNMDIVRDILSPMCRDNIMLCLGNHDGCTGTDTIDGETVYYRRQMSMPERARCYLGWQRTDPRKVFGADGTYYYLDDARGMVRYIVLNTQWTHWDSAYTDSLVTDEQCSSFHVSHFGQSQLSWIADTALDVPDAWSIIFVMHVAPNNRDARYIKDQAVLRDIITAYINRTQCNTSYTGTGDWQSSSISKDFAESKGDIIGIFAGHAHADAIDTTTLPCPIITITTAGSDVRDTDPPPREFGTSSETAVDIVTVDKTNRKIYLTRLGAGDDRVVSY